MLSAAVVCHHSDGNGSGYICLPGRSNWEITINVFVMVSEAVELYIYIYTPSNRQSLHV